MPKVKIKDDHVLCRIYGHAWKPTVVKMTTGLRSKAVVEYRAHLTCLRCATVRVQILGPDGSLGGNRYHYAEGYLQPKGEGPRFERQDVRVEFLRREGLVVHEVEVDLDA